MMTFSISYVEMINVANTEDWSTNMESDDNLHYQNVDHISSIDVDRLDNAAKDTATCEITKINSNLSNSGHFLTYVSLKVD